MMGILGRIRKAWRRHSNSIERINRIQEAIGRIELRQIAQLGLPLHLSEFRVYSQWGEDGIIQALINRVRIDRKIFIEFGVENYTESNTRFLTINNGWAGLVIDGSPDNIRYIREDNIYWSNNLKAECAFITAENINDLIRNQGVSGEIGILSVDIDGNDYWVWEAIDCVNPGIVICEYNSLFGPTAQITIPYDPTFVRDRAHYSKVYYGASISALSSLAERKGYALVASNSVGNNVFFVRKDLLGDIRIVSPVEAYRQCQFREFHNEDGHLAFHDFNTAQKLMSDLDVYDLELGDIAKFGDRCHGL